MKISVHRNFENRGGGLQGNFLQISRSGLSQSEQKLDFQVDNQLGAAYIGRTALVSIHQCPSQQCVQDTANPDDLEKKFCIGVTRTIRQSVRDTPNPDNLEHFSFQRGGVTRTIGKSVG